MRENDAAVRFLYGSRLGRLFLRFILFTHADRIAVAFLCSPFSITYGKHFAKKHNIDLDPKKQYRSYRDVFLRTGEDSAPDPQPSHLISPCDGLLSVFPVTEGGAFLIKGQNYLLYDLIEDRTLADSFSGGCCLVFRLRPRDYHHFCFCDSGTCRSNNYIEGTLHSVQPAACSRYPVYALNRRVWTLLETDHFGPVVQTEVGALIVGKICCLKEFQSFQKGEEMGWFDLAGSTIVLFFQKERLRLCQEIAAQTTDGKEYEVTRSMWIGNGL